MTFGSGTGGAYLYALWTDVDLPEQSEEFAALDAFYSRVHLSEVLRENPGFVTATRGGRTSPDSVGGSASSRWVALYGIADEGSAHTYLERARTGHRARYSALAGSFPDALIGRGRAVFQREEVASDDRAASGAMLMVHHDGQTEEPQAARERWGFRRTSRYRLIQDLGGGRTDLAGWLDIHETDAGTAASAIEKWGHVDVAAYRILTTVTEPAPSAPKNSTNSHDNGKAQEEN